MKTISLEELLEAGCHFGHQVTRHNPKSRDFVFEARDNIHIIDLAKTKEGLEDAASFVKSLAAKGGSLLVVGTKRQAKNIVEEEVKKAIEQTKSELEEKKDADINGIYFITTRWIGGILTNYSEIGKNIKKLKDIVSRLKNEEEKAKYTKKEIGQWQKELSKLRSFYDGILDMKKAPDALFIIDTHNEDLAVREAHKTHVPMVGIVDTNSDPTVINYPIPANDDAVGSIKLIVSYIIDAWTEGRKQFKKGKTEEVSKVSETESIKGTKSIKSIKGGTEENKENVKEESKKAAKKPAVKKKKEEKTEKNVVKEGKAKKTTKKEQK